MLAGGIYMAIPIFKNREMKNSNLISCSYSVSGGMLGGISSSTIRKNSDGSVIYITKSAETHQDRIVTKTYKANDEDLEIIKKLIIDYNMYPMSKKGLSPFQVLDGDTSTLSIMFDNGLSFSISDNLNLSKTEMEKIIDVAKALSTLAKGEAIVEIENHVLALLIDGYQIAYIMIESNATEQILEDSGQYEFNRYEDNAQSATLNKQIDVTDLNKTNKLVKGGLYYDNDNKQLIFVYEDFEYKQDVYQVGEIEYNSDSAYELIRKMENKEYMIMKRK